MSDHPAPSARPLPATPLVDAEARRRIREDLGATLVVEAAAGTGKTSELVARMLAVLRSGAGSLASMVAVTFTEKAAGEMKLRLRAAIEQQRTSGETPPAERARLDASLAELEVARIGTIHALCADLLRERPVEAGVDPLFQVMAEDEARRTFDEVFDAWFGGALSAPSEGVRRMLRQRARAQGGPRARLRDAAFKLTTQRDFDAPWRRDPWDRDAALDHLVERTIPELTAFAGRASRRDDFLAECVDKLGRFRDELERIERVRGRDHDGLEAEIAEVARWWEWRRDGRGQRYGPGIEREQVLATKRAVKAELDAFVEQSSADLAACLFTELWPLVDAFQAKKARAGVVDFHDLLLLARDLLCRSAEVRADLAGRVSHLFVDEFQDTDPLQAEILLLLASADAGVSEWTQVVPVPGKLFLVGDPKQSIYRFRRADVALYQATKERLVAAGAEVVFLTTSFRAVPTLQRAVNAAFAPRMSGGTQADYVALDPARSDPVDRPSLVALPVPAPYGKWGRVLKKEIEGSFPDAVGAFVDWLVTQSGWQVSERERPEAMVPVEARHVCLLFKRFQSMGDDVTRPYVRALEARRLPHVLVGGRSYHEREEVLALRNALTAIEWPDDELRVYATLHGPMFALGDDVLLAFRVAAGGLHPLRRHDLAALPAGVHEVAAALEILGTLHLGRNRRPIADTVTRLLEATRAHAGFAIWPTGEQALANVLRVMDLGRRFEGGGAAVSFRAFVERLEDEAEHQQAADAPVVEEGAEGVRMMTVHRAKGLEFPVVILVDPTAPPRHEKPSRWVDGPSRLWAEALTGLVPRELVEHREEVLARDDEEAVRLTYVAATRARDLLVVPVVGDEPLDGWLAILDPAVQPRRAERRSPAAAPGCPAFGLDSVRAWPLRADRDPTSSVAPGGHMAASGTHRVVWWDPGVLQLECDGDVGLRQQRILAADETLVSSERGERAHAEWKTRRDGLLASGAVPSRRVRSATEVAGAVIAGGLAALEPTQGAAGAAGALPGAPFPAATSVEHLDADVGDRRARPHGKRFGTLVHAVLAEVDLEADPSAIAATGAAVGRLLGCSDEEVTAATHAAARALEHPLLRAAAAAARAGACRREVPVMVRAPDGALLEGVIDLCFREETSAGPCWVVVDFKTDVELVAEPHGYDTQVRVYAEAISQATGERARGALLRV
jgi:ATP-dependent helicase/nuclease subunit A